MEPVYKYYKSAWKSFYKIWFVMLLILVLACLASFYDPLKPYLKWIWIITAIIEVCLFLYMAIRRKTMQLILRDNPDKPEDQEVAFVMYNPLKPFSSDFNKSVEIGLSEIKHIEVGQTMMQTILGIGDLIVTSAGTGGEEIVAKNIPHPQAVRDEIQIHARRYKKPNPTVIVEQAQQ